MTQKNNLQVLPFYDSIEKQHHRKPYAFGQAYPLIASTKGLLPFQLEVDSYYENPLDLNDAEIIYLDPETHISVIQELRDGVYTSSDDTSEKTVITWPAPVLITQLHPGFAYLWIEDAHGNEYYSEVFCLVDDLSRYVRLDWWDNDSEGNPGFINTLYIDTIVGKPKYEFDEEGTDRDGYFFAEKQLSKKVYRFGFVAPEYLCDALRIVRMSDNIQVTFNRETHDCDSIVIEPEWEEQGDLASVGVEFTTGSVIKRIAAGYNWSQVGDSATDDSTSSGSSALVVRISALETAVTALSGDLKSVSNSLNTAIPDLTTRVAELENIINQITEEI